MTPEELEERIRGAMTGEQGVPRNELWESVAVRRAAGERVALPLAQQRRRPLLAISGLIAASLLLVFSFLEQDKPVTYNHTTPDDNPFLPATLFAQSALATQSFGSLMSESTRDLHQGSWTHSKLRGGDATTVYTFSLQHSSFDGRPGWLLISSKKEGKEGWSSLDSLWASGDSMTPLFRVSHTDSIRTERTYRDESVLTGITVGGYTSWSIVPREDRAMLGAGLAATLFRMPEIAIRMQAASLTQNWNGSLPIRALGMDRKPATFWLNMKVVGHEQIEVPAGRFDCWKVRLLVGPYAKNAYDPANPPPGLYYWVSRDQQWLIRIGWEGADNTNAESIELVAGEEK